MENTNGEIPQEKLPQEKPSQEKESYTIHILLFVLTVITTTMAGTEWMYGKLILLGDVSFSEFLSGFNYSIPLLGILTFHEFGHYFMAKYYKIKVSLPYYIPVWAGIFLMIGTMGAFIRIREAMRSRRQYFDVGIAGPLAGFVVALVVLTYGFTHLPPKDYIYSIHPEYHPDYVEQKIPETTGKEEANEPIIIKLGDNLLFKFFETYVADTELVPSKYEMYHYPWLFAGYIALFFTALNLLPIGQLDGGHVIYGLFGAKYSFLISRSLFLILTTASGIAWMPAFAPMSGTYAGKMLLYLVFLFYIFYHFQPDIKKRLLIVIWVFIAQLGLKYYVPEVAEYGIYIAFSFLLGRILGLRHPNAPDNKPLDLKRKILGWITLVVFVVSFTPQPLSVVDKEKARFKEAGPQIKEVDSSSEVVTRRMIEFHKIV